MPLPSLLHTKMSSRGNSLHVLLTAAFAAFVLVLFGHRLTFPIRESHESSFQFASICSPPLRGYNGRQTPESVSTMAQTTRTTKQWPGLFPVAFTLKRQDIRVQIRVQDQCTE